MGYCGQCGAELPPSGKYCIKCGSPFEGAPQFPRESDGQSKRSDHGNLEACILAALAVYGVAGILSVLMGSPFGVILCVLLFLALGFAFQKLKKNDYQMVQYLCLGTGIAACMLVLVDLSAGDGVAALVNVIAAVPLGYACYELRSNQQEKA